MAVAFNAKATADTTSGTAATSVSINNLTIGAISNVALLVFCSFNSDPGAITTKTWNGVSLIEVGRHAASDGATGVLLAMVGAATGNHTLSLAWANLTGYTIDLASYSGADQGSAAATFKNFTFLASSVSTGTDAILIAVNSPTNDMAVACVASLNVGLGAGLTGTNIYFDNTNVSGAAAYVAGSGVSSQIGFDVSGTTNQPQVTVACNIAAVGTVGTTLNFGWYRRNTEDQQLPILRGIERENTFSFVRSPNPVPQIWLPKAGGGDVERLPPIGRSPDEATPFFVRSPHPVPTTWLPTAGERERPPPVGRSPDEAAPFFKPPTPTVPISGMAWQTPAQDRERPPPIPPDPSATALSFKAPPAANTNAGIPWWRPADDAHPPSRYALGDPYTTQAMPFFVEAPLQVFMASSNADDFSPIKPVFPGDGMAITWAARVPPAQGAGISGMAWSMPSEPINRTYPGNTNQAWGTTWNPRTPPIAANTNAGIPWWIQSEPIPRSYPGVTDQRWAPTWAPQVVVQLAALNVHDHPLMTTMGRLSSRR